ncbi:MAG: energy transducer TonB [candidate division WOR-3 bacterium]|nr:energy transducer TonB [candidate division WOR-3 bacterium]
MKRKFPSYKIAILLSLIIFIGVFAGLPAFKTSMPEIARSNRTVTEFRQLPPLERIDRPETVQSSLPKKITESNDGDETDISDMTTDFNNNDLLDNTTDRTIYRTYEKSPSLLTDLNPVYPETAKQLGIEGTVIIQLLVEKDGSVSSVEVLRSIHPLLDNAAKAAALNLRFSPAMTRDIPIRCYISIPITFSLE